MKITFKFDLNTIGDIYDIIYENIPDDMSAEYRSYLVQEVDKIIEAGESIYIELDTVFMKFKVLTKEEGKKNYENSNSI